ncbi:MAG: alpha/beta hydrolase [Gloeocapsa sp. UFS-A4-WI-NPMV-4B04]|jgi:pimeloyl-ACP methyl ester carboxylesterase|nr:alpha/beta hydrolase [Gloeocapsa sp. UFS-A4-WI-NPMV-4B04]
MPNVRVGNIDLYYEIGKVNPLLVIMGLKFSLLDWGEKLPQKLVEKYQVILFDNRNSGRSSRATNTYSIADMANDTSGLLDELGITKAHVFGISMGGAIANL